MPFNQSSVQDCESLINHIYSGAMSGVDDVDFLLPFAASSENGRDISDIDDRSECCHRLMLTNVVRLIGRIRSVKREREITNRPCYVLLPLSPNHGAFGNDGLYAESKLGLEALLNKQQSEGWADYVTIAGAVIGWTRGTGLMDSTDVVAPGMEQQGIRTFSQSEMAFNLISLLHPRMLRRAYATDDNTPLLADLSGGFNKVPNLMELVTKLRRGLDAQSAVAKATAADQKLEKECLGHLTAAAPMPALATADAPGVTPAASLQPQSQPQSQPQPQLQAQQNILPLPVRATSSRVLRSEFPPLPDAPTRARQALSAAKAQALVDMRKVVVCVGYGEVGPWGSARTRWDMEAHGTFSLEGCIELAWMLGMIRHHNGPLSVPVPHTAAKLSGEADSVADSMVGDCYVGWVDAKTGEPVPDIAVKGRYESRILEHAGIRTVDPSLFEGYDPTRKRFFHSLALAQAVGPLEVQGREEAMAFVKELGEAHVRVHPPTPTPDAASGGGEVGCWSVTIRKGAVLTIPKALQIDRQHAGQIPNGWSAARLGIPEDIAESVDPVTLYALVSTAEALLAAGITDSYELFSYVHVSEVGNCSGGGMGGMQSLRNIFHDRSQCHDLASDTLQETFINTMPAWVNMLLLSSSGPIKTPVGACATAAESVDVGMDTILSGKARVVVVGGCDDFSETSAFEFAQMQATSSSAREAAMGRGAREMCRPCTDTRAGFMESHGAGMQVLTDAALALKMGLPIYAVLAHTATATDKQGRSVPAPGAGILTTARETKSKAAATNTNPLLDLHFRREQLQVDLKAVRAWERNETQSMELAALSADAVRARLEAIAHISEKKKAAATALWGKDCLSHPTVSPLRQALAAWGLCADDIAVASFHGTGTKANDENESEVTHMQMEHIGRSQGNPLLVVCQKHLTGHPKGAAAAWMMNGLLQVLSTGLVPGNRNNDNTDASLRQYSSCMYPNRTIHVTGGIKAALMKSFGFGQASGEILLLHPTVLLSVLGDGDFDAYAQRRQQRAVHTHVYMQETLCEERPMVKVRDRPPYVAAVESDVLLDPTLRARSDPKAGTYTFDWLLHSTPTLTATTATMLAAPPLAVVSPDASPIPATSAAMRRALEKEKQTADTAPLPFEPELSTAEARLKQTVQEAAEGLMPAPEQGIGLDVETIATFSDWESKQHFIERNFTEKEVAYIRSTPHPPSSFAGRWAAKEAVVKAISSATEKSVGRSLWQGGGGALRCIEVLPSASGAPQVQLHGHAASVYKTLRLEYIRVSISHTLEYAVAQAVVS